MKKLLFLLPIGLFLSACSNDFEVTAPWKEIPVVYGILSPQDTAHYIRIEKAFLDPERSALEIAQIPDSLYYPANAITVWLEDKATQNRLQLQRVNGTLEGYPRAGGLFATEPNWLYKAKSSGNFTVQGGKTYRLVIERADGKPDVVAETTLSKDFMFSIPNPNNTSPIGFENNVPGTQIKWGSDENAFFFNVTFVIRYEDRNANGTIASINELIWEAATNVERTSTMPGSGNLFTVSENFAMSSFHNFLAQNLQRPPGNMYRVFRNCDVIVDGGGAEIKEFLETAQANSGLTGAETFPNYTNVSEGYGIFTGKTRSIAQNIRISTKTVDSMNVRPLTDSLRFSY